MRHRPSKVWNGVHDAARKSMLAAEARMRFEMAKTLADCRGGHADVTDAETRAIRISADMLNRLPAVILRGRLKAKQASALHLATQLAVATRLGARGLPSVVPATATTLDEQRARAAARSFAAAWLRSALEAIDARRVRQRRD